jgi:hypothetical protein
MTSQFEDAFSIHRKHYCCFEVENSNKDKILLVVESKHFIKRQMTLRRIPIYAHMVAIVLLDVVKVSYQ